MKRAVLLAVLLAAIFTGSVAQAHRWHGGGWGGGWRGGGWHGGWGGGWRGGWHGGWRGGGWHGGWGGGWRGGWHGVGWRGGWNGGWGWNRPVVWGPSWGWGGSGFVGSPGFWPGPVYSTRTIFVSPSFSPGWGGCGYYGYSSPAVIPPAALYVRADAAYGPDAMKEFMGVDRDFATGPLAPARTLVVRAPVEDDFVPRVVAAPQRVAPKIIVAKPAPQVQLVKEPVASTAEAKARAARFIALGDEQFGGQQFHSAAQRYRSAAVAAPDVADAHFRQGFAYLASNRNDLAVAAFRRGLAIDPLWVNSSFRIDDLYDGAGLAKSSHIDGLARATLANRSSADHYFLIGLLLHFDGQQARAKRFFERAEQLKGSGDKSHISVFLKPPARRRKTRCKARSNGLEPV